MPNLTKKSVLKYLEKESSDANIYWKLNYYDREKNKQYEMIFFKGNRYSAVLKARKFLLEERCDLFEIFDFCDQDYAEEDDQFDTFEESVKDYIDHFFNGDS